MKDTLNTGIEIIMPAVAFEKAVHAKHETNVQAVTQKLKSEYNDWLSVRDYVRKNMYKLKGTHTKIEVTSLTDITDPYNCVVVNDMDMRSYQAVYDEIKELEEKIEQIRINESLDAGLCPSGCGEVRLSDQNSRWYSEWPTILWHRCDRCLADWDYDKQDEKLLQLISQIRKKGRLKHGS